MTAATVKAAEFGGIMLLVGGSVSGLWLAPGVLRHHRRLLTLLIWIGAVLVAALGLVEVRLTLLDVLGRADGELFARYLRSTKHGAVVTARLWLVPLLALLTTLALRTPRPAAMGRTRQGGSGAGGWATAARPALHLASAGVAVALLVGFSRVSHAAAMGGAAPLVADLIHLAAAAGWAGPLIYLALLPDWGERQEAMAALARLSAVGAAAVSALIVTGTFNVLTHLSEPTTFVRSAYGWSLWVKLALFGLVVAVAARNRFRTLPRFLRGGPVGEMRVPVRLEAALVVLLLAATGALTTSALPHGDSGPASAWQNLLRLLGL